MRALVRLVLLVALVLGVVWLLKGRDPQQVSRDAKAEVGSAVRRAKETVSDLDVGAMVEELKRTGRVVRRKTEKAAVKIDEATADARTTAAIKAKLALDPGLSALEISVDTTDGLVTLAGRVDSAEDMARAIRIAYEQDNVREVVSTLRIAKREAAAK